ncbi:MAG TPA: DUF6607 family protein [Dongiaceae bacterium]|nr:DUF6607 family protein [Dongiaceae bacterium]
MSKLFSPHTVASILVILALSNASSAQAAPADSSKNAKPAAGTSDCSPRQYIFSWSFADQCLPQPRGGSTKGAKVTLDTSASPQWQALQAPGLSKFERDRRAVLAMTGGFRTSFEFLETVGYPVDYELARPYQSWGTEYVYVVEDRGDFISLQHIMVMVFQQEDGKPSEPMVMKHWRQDWHYQDPTILEYVGHDTWQTRHLSPEDVQGAWSQSVYQVDDSPRYASVGTWQHNDSFSVWESGDTWRPLPRREHTVRNDYEVLEGVNRHVILPTGWVQEEENLKRRATGTDAKTTTFVAKELGNNRYQRIKDFDWSAGDTFWKQTGPYWAIVRQQWDQLSDRNPRFALKEKHDNAALFEVIFQQADEFAAGKLKEPEQAVEDTLKDYLVR